MNLLKDAFMQKSLWQIGLLSVAAGMGTFQSDALAQSGTISSNPKDYAASSAEYLYVGNSSKTNIRLPNSGGAAPTLVPAPLASNDFIYLNERVDTGSVYARREAKLKLQAHIVGDLVVTNGKLATQNSALIEGDVIARNAVALGTGSVVEGDVTSTNGSVKLIRLSQVKGNVVAKTEFRGDRDILVGEFARGSDPIDCEVTRGSNVTAFGTIQLRDRGVYAGNIFSPTAPKLAQRPPVICGNIGAPSTQPPTPIDWSLNSLSPSLFDFTAGTAEVSVPNGETASLAPGGLHGEVNVGRDSTLVLSSGVYTFDSFSAGMNATLKVDLTAAPHTIEIRVKKEFKTGRRFAMSVKRGSVTNDDADAANILFKVAGNYRGLPDATLYGTILGKGSVIIGKNTTLIGAVAGSSEVHLGTITKLFWVRSNFNF